VTSAPACPALDAGSATAKVALDGAAEEVVPSPVPDGDWRVRVSSALAAAGLGVPADGLCLAVPEAWLDGSADGTTAQESLRHACEDELGMARIIWTGQLAAVAAATARHRGPGRYLVCDIGAAGVRTAALDVADAVIRILAAHSASGGGWRDFDACLRCGTDEDDPLPADWWSAAEQDRRARAVLPRAVSSAGYRETPAYTFPGPHGDRDLLAGQVIDCFAPTEQHIRAGAAQALDSGPADVAVLTGGLGTFPLASTVLADATGIIPIVEDPGAAARGALLFARGTVRLAPPPALAQIALPMHRTRDGLLEDVSLILPWTEPFASPPDEPPVLDDPELTVDIAGQRATVPLPGLVPGPCRVGVRPGWSGSGALVVRPASGEGAPVVVGLDALAISDR
jgi:hypothetical protein